MVGKLFLIFFYFQIFAMNVDDQTVPAEKCSKINSGEFYRAQSEGKIIYFLGTMHNIGCSDFAKSILVKVMEQLKRDQVFKIDILWTEALDYSVPNSPHLDSYYFEGLKSIAKSTRSLDVYTWKRLKSMNVREYKWPVSIKEAAKDCQSFMRGYPKEMCGFTSEWVTQTGQNLRQIYGESHEQWLQKLLNGKKIQFVITGAAHNWVSTGVMKSLGIKGWETSQINLNMNDGIEVTPKMLQSWKRQKKIHADNASTLKKNIIAMRIVRDLVLDSPVSNPVLFVGALVAHAVAIFLFHESLIAVVVTAIVVLFTTLCFIILKSKIKIWYKFCSIKK